MTVTIDRSADDKNRINSISKMMDVLSCFSTVHRSFGLAQIASAAGLPRATAHRMLAALREIGFIEQDGRSGNYSLGIRLFELGSLALANMDLLREAKPHMDRLSRLTGQPAHLGLFNGYAVVVVEREEPDDRPTRALPDTETAPAHCTGVGKAVLAFQGEDVVDRVIEAGLKAYTANTIATRERLLPDLATIRARGYSIDDCEHQIWVRCVAAPVRNASGHVFAAISVTGPADRMTMERLEQLAPVVVQTADTISRQLGYVPATAA
jgi:DNA-binding IclR family transcriptional regulator